MNQDTKGPVTFPRSWTFPRVGGDLELGSEGWGYGVILPLTKPPLPLCPFTLSPCILVFSQMFICLLTLGLE